MFECDSNMTATTENSKKESQEMATKENGNRNAPTKETPIESPQKSLKLQKVSNGQLEKRVYKIVLTGGKNYKCASNFMLFSS